MLNQRRGKQDHPHSSSSNSNRNENHIHNGNSSYFNKRTCHRRSPTTATLFLFVLTLLGSPIIQSKLERMIAQQQQQLQRLRQNTEPTLYQEQYLIKHQSRLGGSSTSAEGIHPSQQQEAAHFTATFDTKPRMIAFLAPPINNKNDDEDHLKRVVVRIDPNIFHIKDNLSALTSKWDDDGMRHRRHVDYIGTTADLSNVASDDERYSPAYRPPEDCVPQHDWQTQMFPTCNALHEQDMVGQSITNSHSKFLLGEGSWRSVWLVRRKLGLSGKDEKVAMKMFRYDKFLTERNFQRQIVDHIVAERLTASPHVLDIYSYCGASALYEFASGGSLRDVSDANKEGFESWSIDRKLQVAHQVASGVADLHDIDHNGRAAVYHGDIDDTQFVSTNGGKTYKLNDFNGARFLFVRDRNHTDICPVKPSLLGGKHRSPEDYRRELVTEKSDVYGLGNVLYMILVGNMPFQRKSYEDAQDLIVRGHRDHIPSRYKESRDPRIQAIVQGIEKCWIQEPYERANARTVAALLKAAME